MKKVLFASTALVAAGLMTATTASASEKIKLNVGGFSKWWVVGQFNQDKYQRAAGVDYNNVDIKGDNEIFFGGSTTLDNGMKVGVQIEFEAGGHTDATSDPIDESYAWLETGFGKFIIGSENNGTYLLHVQAPDAAGNWGEGGIMTGGAAIEVPTNVASVTPAQRNWNTTAIVTDNDAEKITYVAPTFFGLTLGASYAPNVAGEDNRGLQNLRTATAGEVFGVGGLYANTFGGVGVKVSAGWATYNIGTGAAGGGTHTGDGDVNEYAAGAQFAYAGFTLGGSYRQVDGYKARTTDLQDSFEAKAWDVGVQYATGPYAVSLAYFQSKAAGDVTNAAATNSRDDEIQLIQLSGKYNLGAGVDVLASVGHAEFKDEHRGLANQDANNNKGWTVMTGLGLSF